MKQKKIAKEILERFVELKATPGYRLDYEWLKNHFKKKLKPNEMNLLSQAVDELFEQALITFDNDAEAALVLTEKGFENLYHADEKKTVKRLCKEIMDRFKKEQSTPNHLLIFSWLEQSLSNEFNPREMQHLPNAIKSLVSEGFVETDEKHNSALLLTHKGFDFINKEYSLKKAG